MALFWGFTFEHGTNKCENVSQTRSSENAEKERKIECWIKLWEPTNCIPNLNIHLTEHWAIAAASPSMNSFVHEVEKKLSCGFRGNQNSIYSNSFKLKKMLFQVLQIFLQTLQGFYCWFALIYFTVVVCLQQYLSRTLVILLGHNSFTLRDNSRVYSAARSRTWRKTVLLTCIHILYTRI